VLAMAMDVTKAFSPAIEHTANVLFRPFVFKKWLGLGFVALLAGSGGGGGGGGNSGGSWPGPDESWPKDPASAGHLVQQWFISHIVLIVLGALLLIGISILFAWLSSVMKLVYVDQITRSSGAVKEPFARLKGLGTSFFLFGICFGLISLLALGTLVGLPLAAVFVGHMGTAAVVIAVIWAILVGIACVVVMGAASVFADDFVLPTMYVRNVRVLEAWRIILPVLKANAGQSVLYLLLLIVIGIVTGIGAVLIALAMLLVFALPGVALGAIGYIIYQAGANTWTATLIAYTAIFGSALLLAYGYATTCAMQPLTVFRRSYGLIVLGQADPSLTTVPVIVAPPIPPQPPAGYSPAAPSG
jgi:hypothetical protein